MSQFVTVLLSSASCFLWWRGIWNFQYVDA